VASEIKITSYPWLKASLRDVSTHIDVSTPANTIVFIPRASNHTLISVSWKAESLRAAKYAIKVAKMANADIFFMHTVVNPPYGDPGSGGMMISAYIKEATELAELWYINAGNMASEQGVKFTAETVLDVASAADSIVNYAENKKADLIVIGTKGRTGLKRLLLGSVASWVLTHASCLVLISK
jgi:nucleotide-binding universal stress UspA family protein